MRQLTAILVAFLLNANGFTQSATKPSIPEKQYFFNHITTATGLISYQVNITVQDEDGFIWIATNDGLQRFDGIRYKTFRHSDIDSTSLPSNLIWQLLIDREKNLWVFTIEGKCGIFNTKTLRFTPAVILSENESLLATNAVFKGLRKDESGNIFLVVPGGELLSYNKAGNRFSKNNNFPALKRELSMRAFAQQPGTNKYWMYADETGLAIYNNSTRKLNYPGNNPDKEPAIDLLNNNEKVINLYFDTKGRLWVIKNNGDNPSVSCIDPLTNQLILKDYRFDKNLIGYHEIRSMYEQKDGTIWIIGQKIFAKFLEAGKDFQQVHNGFSQEHGIDFVTITSLMEDREQNLWVSTANNGIFRFNPSNEFFSNIHYISHTTSLPASGAPACFMQDRDGSFLVGMKEEGFYRFDKNLEKIPLHINGIPDKNTLSIWDICPSGDSNFFWLGAKDGIYKYDLRTKSVSFLQPEIFKNKTIKRILEDRQGKLWIGTQEAGMFTWQPSKGSINTGLEKLQGIPDVRINRIITDRQGFIWAATSMAGAYMINPVNDSVVLHFSLKGEGSLKLPEQSVLSILDYNDSLVFIGTNSRLLIYNRHLKTLRPFGGALSGFVSSMEKDDEEHLWVSTTTAIYRVTPKTRVFLQMNRNDGLENDFFLLGSSRVLADKRMMFGVYGAIVVFNPSSMTTNPMVPDLKITGFMVNDKSLLVDSLLKQKTIVLAPEQNSLLIDLSVLSFNSGYLLKAKMQGLDTGWKTVDQKNQLIYSYLPPGSYILKVETIDADGKIGERTLQVPIKINAPFWRTWWFYSAVLLAIFIILYWIDKQKTSRRAAFQKMRSNIAGNLHREVNTTLNNINILSEMARLKADNNPEKAKEFIGQIHIKSDQMITAMDDMLWSIDPANDSMTKTMDRLKEFIEKLNNGQGAGIEILVDEKVEKLKIDMQLRHDALLLIRENVQTQVLCGCRNILIHISHEKSNLVYHSQCNSENCDIKMLRNFLYSKEMKKRLDAIPAQMEVDENKSEMMIMLKFSID